MKKLLLLSCIVLLGGVLVGQQPKTKLYVHMESSIGYSNIVFIEDLETGTRCYAITAGVPSGGNAISCVKK